MRRVVTACLGALLLVLLAAAAASAQQNESERLLAERAVLIEKLSQPQSPVVQASLRAALEKIDKRLRKLGVEPPPLPESVTQQVQEAPPSTAPRPVEGPEELLAAEARPAPSSGGADELDRPISHPHPAPSASRYHFDFNVSPWFRSNYFQAVADSPSESVTGTELSADFRVALARAGDRSLTAAAGVHRNVVRGIAGADWSLFEAILVYAAGAHELGVRGYYIPRQLTFITSNAEPGHGRTIGAGADYNSRPTRRTRTRLLYRMAQVRFEDFAERDLTVHRVGGELRHRFHSLFIPGVGVEYTRAPARSENATYDEIAPVVLYGARLGRWVSLNARYRYKQRNYTVADLEADNFGRRDHRHDLSMYTSVRLGPQWEVIFFGGYMRNLSTRAARIFTDANGGLTLRFRLPAH